MGGFGHTGGYGVASGMGSPLVTFFILFFVFILVVYIMYRARANRGALQSAGVQRMELRPDDPSVAMVRADAIADQVADSAAALTAMRAADPDFEPETFLQRAEMTFFLVKRAYQRRGTSRRRNRTSFQPSWLPSPPTFRSSLESTGARFSTISTCEDCTSPAPVMMPPRETASSCTLTSSTETKVLDDRDEGGFFRIPETTIATASAGQLRTIGRREERYVRRRRRAKMSQLRGSARPFSDARCEYCQAKVTSGAFDWSVSAITPAPFTGLALDPLLDQVVLPPDQGIAAIKAADPNFDPAAFVARVQKAFGALQAAWQARDVDTARAFMSPGLYFSWSAQVEQMAEQHRRNILENLRVDRVTPVRVLHGHVFDDVTVRIDATCADYEIDEGTQRIVFGDKTPRPFTEYWTFQRAIEAKTGERTLLDKVCPNCGAPLDVNQLGECKYCKAAVTSGRFDWVLSRIEQEEEYAEEFARGG